MLKGERHEGNVSVMQFLNNAKSLFTLTIQFTPEMVWDTIKIPQCIYFDGLISNLGKPGATYRFRCHLSSIILLNILAKLPDSFGRGKMSKITSKSTGCFSIWMSKAAFISQNLWNESLKSKWLRSCSVATISVHTFLNYLQVHFSPPEPHEKNAPDVFGKSCETDGNTLKVSKLLLRVFGWHWWNY